MAFKLSNCLHKQTNDVLHIYANNIFEFSFLEWEVFKCLKSLNQSFKNQPYFTLGHF